MQTSFTPFARLSMAIKLLLTLALLFAMTPVSAYAAQECAETHTVTAHETIWRLVKKYGVSANRIAQANRLERPYTLKEGQKICIPSKSAGGLGANISVSATLSDGSVTITGSGFPKSHVYKVKGRDTGAWYVLGENLRVDKNGAIQKTRYKLPAELKGKTVLTICLKDMGTDAMGCFTATPPQAR